jgi:hypothetical protein
MPSSRTAAAKLDGPLAQTEPSECLLIPRDECIRPLTRPRFAIPNEAHDFSVGAELVKWLAIGVAPFANQ